MKLKFKARRWRVARMKKSALGGVESPNTRYWTKRGASAAANQLNALHERYGVQRSMFTAIQGDSGAHYWTAVRHRTLRGVQAMNIVQSLGVISDIKRTVEDPSFRVNAGRPNRQAEETQREETSSEATHGGTTHQSDAEPGVEPAATVLAGDPAPQTVEGDVVPQREVHDAASGDSEGAGDERPHRVPRGN